VEALREEVSEDEDVPSSWLRQRLRIWSMQLQDRPFALATAVGVVGAFVAGLVVWFVLTAPPARVEDRLPRVGQAVAALPASPVSVAQSTAGVSDVAVVHVHMAGEVTQPGLYRLAAGSRVADLLDAAGGPTPMGDADRLNLAALLEDGERVVVPAIGGDDELFYDAAVDELGLINVNRADATMLATLPGIGPTLAVAIVNHREANGEFVAIDSLENVPGIGPSKVALLRELVTV
jgi:competence protein ComEA